MSLTWVEVPDGIRREAAGRGAGTSLHAELPLTTTNGGIPSP